MIFFEICFLKADNIRAEIIYENLELFVMRMVTVYVPLYYCRFLQEFEQDFLRNVIAVVSCDFQWVCWSECVLEEALDLGII